jgi:hypothetical protein
MTILHLTTLAHLPTGEDGDEVGIMVTEAVV